VIVLLFLLGETRLVLGRRHGECGAEGCCRGYDILFYVQKAV
jgi:hypothetical protein